MGPRGKLAGRRVFRSGQSRLHRPGAGGHSSGLALSHLHRPRFNGSGSLHLGGGRGRLRQFHGSQAGLLVHSGLCL